MNVALLAYLQPITMTEFYLIGKYVRKNFPQASQAEKNESKHPKHSTAPNGRSLEQKIAST